MGFGIAFLGYCFLLMHAAGANVSGQIASVIAGGLVITLIENAIAAL